MTFEPGTKSEPMKISGQVPAVSGEGDFLLELPLDGEVDFEVTDTNADGSACSNAVATLRQRLADRGIAFTVTDWGHGHDPAAASPSPPSGRRARHRGENDHPPSLTELPLLNRFRDERKQVSG